MAEADTTESILDASLSFFSSSFFLLIFPLNLIFVRLFYIAQNSELQLFHLFMKKLSSFD